ncbi:MAG: chemotaxis protein CheD [Sulfitobacter sp.]
MTDNRIVITQGEHAVSDQKDVAISTLLGSCVACCLWDPLSGVGGMNHMLITSRTERAARCDAVGVHSMELLINDLLKLGAKRDRLRAKAFGGAQMVSGLSGIGAANCAFTLNFLEREKIPCLSQSLGGDVARHLLFWPTTGVARQKLTREVKMAEVRGNALPLPRGNGLELL